MMATYSAEMRWSGDWCVTYDAQSDARNWFLECNYCYAT
jgi:hypothetical protein